MIIDNFDLIRKYLVFDRDNDPDTFYYVQIIQRRKDEGVTIKKNCKMIRSYYVTSLRYWDDHEEQIKELCRTFKARAYVHLNPRSWKKCVLMAFGELATYLRSNQCSSLRKLTEEMAGKYIADGANKTWIVDIDSKDDEIVSEISGRVNECMPVGNKVVDLIPTKNGYHLITKPFNLMEFRKYYKEGEVDIQKIIQRFCTMKIRVNGIEFDVDVSTITYHGIPVMEIIKDACDLAHQALIDLSTYRQEHNCGNQDEWELGELELDFCKFLDKLGD